MSTIEIDKLLLTWGSRYISSDFNEEHMKKNVSLLGLDSIDVAGLCEFVEDNSDLEVDFDWVLQFETLNDMVDHVKLNNQN